MEQKSDSGAVILSFMLGVVIGGILGILFAPRSGKETRQKIREFIEEASEKVSELVEEGKGKATELTKEVKEKAVELVKEGRKKLEEKLKPKET